MAETREENVKLSRFISKILRHSPEVIGIRVEREGGWADVNKLIDGISKRRYSFNADGSKIRANQGHSIDFGDF